MTSREWWWAAGYCSLTTWPSGSHDRRHSHDHHRLRRPGSGRALLGAPPWMALGAGVRWLPVVRGRFVPDEPGGGPEPSVPAGPGAQASQEQGPSGPGADRSFARSGGRTAPGSGRLHRRRPSQAGRNRLGRDGGPRGKRVLRRAKRRRAETGFVEIVEGTFPTDDVEVTLLLVVGDVERSTIVYRDVL